MINRKTLLTNKVKPAVMLLSHEERGITIIPEELYIVMDNEYMCTQYICSCIIHMYIICII